MRFINNHLFKRATSSLRASFERFGRTMLIPVSVLPILALIGSIGYFMISTGSHRSFVNGKLVKDGIYDTNAIFKAFADGIKYTGMLAIYNIDIIFAIGLSVGLAKKEKPSAAITGLTFIIAMYVGGGVIAKFNGETKGIIDRFAHHTKSYDFGAVGGILAGIISYQIHKYTHTIRFPKLIGYFGGTKFPPVVGAIFGSIFGVLLALIWIPLYSGLKQMGQGFRGMKTGGAFLYGFTNRLLAPFGLHHVVNAIIRYTPAGGTWKYGSETFEGMFNVMLGKVSSGQKIYAQDSMISTGTYVNNIFSMSGVAIAMYFAVGKEKRKDFAPIIFGATGASIAAGVTEPIEFSFIFVSPLLFFIHTILTGLAYMTMYIVGGAQMAFTGEGIVTYFAYNVLNYDKVNRFWMLFVIGPLFTFIYFIVFYSLIKKLNIQTPGRGKRVSLYSKKEFKDKKNIQEIKKIDTIDKKNITKPKKVPGGKDIFWNKSFRIIEAYGKKDNILEVSNCISRLRITVKNKDLVNKDLLLELGSTGVINVGQQIQAVFGTDAQYYASCMKIILGIE